MTRIAWAIDEINMNGRHRAELGDLEPLASSIKTVGLLHPIVVTPEGRLVAGQRRLEACRLLGWKRIPVSVASNLHDINALLAAERDENTHRLDMTPSEKVAMARSLEALERPKAKARQAAAGPSDGKGRKTGSENFTEPLARGETRDIIGAAVGMSGVTYYRAKTVVDASEDESLSDDVRKLAQDARRKMDETGKVSAAFNRVAPHVGKKPMGKKPDATEEQRPAATPRTKTHRGRKAPDAIRGAINTLCGLVTGFETFTVEQCAPTPTEAQEWQRELSRSVSILNRFRKQLRGYAHG